MNQEFRGIPLGQYPSGDPTETKIVYRTPPDFILGGSNQLITLAKDNNGDQFVLTFWTWCRDYRFKPQIKGTWYGHEQTLNKKQLHALQHMDFGGLQNNGH